MKRACRFDALVASLAMALALATSAAAVEPVANSAAASPRLKYLPADAWLVGECNVGAIMQLFNTPEAAQNPQFAQFKQAMQMITMMTGIDPERQISHVSLFAGGTPGDGATGLVVIQGSFDNAAVEPRIAGMAGGAAPQTYKNRALHATPNGEDLLSFPEPSTMLFGDRGSGARRDRLRWRAGPRPCRRPCRTCSSRTPADSVVWAAVTPRTILDQPNVNMAAVNPELHAQLSKLDCASLYFSLSGDGLLVQTLGYASANRRRGGTGPVSAVPQGRHSAPVRLERRVHVALGAVGDRLQRRARRGLAAADGRGDGRAVEHPRDRQAVARRCANLTQPAAGWGTSVTGAGRMRRRAKAATRWSRSSSLPQATPPVRASGNSSPSASWPARQATDSASSSAAAATMAVAAASPGRRLRRPGEPGRRWRCGRRRWLPSAASMPRGSSTCSWRAPRR